MNERYEEKVERLKDKINKYKLKCDLKDQQIYDLQLKLDQEIEQKEETAKELELKL